MEKFYRIGLHSHGASEPEVHRTGQEFANSSRVSVLPL